MIDLHNEEVIRLRDVPQYLPGRPHIATLYRWAQRRAKPLETVRIGGRLYTSLEALQRFAERCTTGNTAVRQSARTRHEHERAKRELAEAGI